MFEVRTLPMNGEDTPCTLWDAPPSYDILEYNSTISGPGIYGDVGDLVFMQWTGTTDHNGVAVYEGDVLEIGNDIAGISCKAVVEYIDTEYWLIEKGGTMWTLFGELYEQGTDGQSGLKTKPAYVVGNIYEQDSSLPTS